MLQSMLTTTDNPYDPWDDFDNWFAFDERMGYHTAGLLARLTADTEELGESSTSYAIEEAIDEIVEENVLGIYKKITRDVENVRT